jgi:hypothetical protein
MGQRQSRAEMANEGLRGDLLLERYVTGWGGRPRLLAYLVEPGTTQDMLPRLESARVARVREALTIVGTEAVPRGRKSVERHAQTWVCAVEPIAHERWPERPRERLASGFDPVDDDYA